MAFKHCANVNTIREILMLNVWKMILFTKNFLGTVKQHLLLCFQVRSMIGASSVFCFYVRFYGFHFRLLFVLLSPFAWNRFNNKTDVGRILCAADLLLPLAHPKSTNGAAGRGHRHACNCHKNRQGRRSFNVSLGHRWIDERKSFNKWKMRKFSCCMEFSAWTTFISCYRIVYPTYY